MAMATVTPQPRSCRDEWYDTDFVSRWADEVRRGWLVSRMGAANFSPKFKCHMHIGAPKASKWCDYLQLAPNYAQQRAKRMWQILIFAKYLLSWGQ